MLLAIDIGNTNMEFGVFSGNEIIASFRLVTNRDITSDEIGLFTSQFFQENSLDRRDINDIVIASVVPQVMYSITNAVKKYFYNKVPLIVGDNLPFDIVNCYDNPRDVGADRLVAAIAAYKKYGGPLIVVDFGTATTFDAIGPAGEYLGGAIYPGIKISMDALFTKAAKLPRVELVRPASVIGRNTVTSLQSGAVNGYVGAVRNIVSLMKREMGGDVRVVATGGLAKLVGDETDIFLAIDRSLMLDGLYLLYESYQKKQGRMAP
ncbi:type III pantothenate kinase [Anaerotruncus sp. 1XD42-93]|uniref:type III pantothenate kinase n=1 Tax=Anaerotruncus sp. 1XD42-93 TaxID=2320853 RepID=UPI000EA2BF01|nr:type III pantothenate kinase [Anaerotruncus sp. 1XD42-93]NBK18509.1 type III pantothenate kinase [Anaerotruncus sp. 1XD42-93]RKJ85754.1 type III pantothenate kinase [Anaerotruncus sp. 1XD22-93]